MSDAVEEKEPPITIKSLIESCWGLSLTFSHEEYQRSLGENFRKTIFETISSYQVVKKDKTMEVLYSPSPNTKKFFDNVSMAMVKTLRNIGLARNSHTNYLDSLANEFEDSKNYYKSLSSFVSFDKEGLAPKVLSFIFGSSLPTFHAYFNNISTGLNSETQEKITEAIRNAIPDDVNATKLIESISKLNDSGFPISANHVIISIIFGLAGLAIFNLVVKKFEKDKLQKILKEIRLEQMNYYYNYYREDMVVYLSDFYLDILQLIQKFYDVKYEEQLDLSNIEIDKEEFDLRYSKDSEVSKNNWEPLSDGWYKLKESTLTPKKRVNMFIRYRVLPTWFFSPYPSKT